MKIFLPSPDSNRPGRFAIPTLFRRLRSVLPVIAVGFLLAAVALPEMARAQEDLNVPGLTDDEPEPDPRVQVSGDGTVTQDDTTLLGLIAKGGWAMWVLGMFSFAVAGLAIYCIIDLRRQNFCPEELRAQLHDAWSDGNLEAVHESVAGNPTTLARMTEPMANHIGETGYSPEDNDLLRGLMIEAGQKHNRLRARIVNWFSVLAQASPMMGLLGTVSGMIKAFGSLGRTGMAKPEELAGHISEALVTTATGLIIALPAIFAYFFFRDRIEELILECEDFGMEVLGILRRSAIAAAEGLAGDEVFLPEDGEPVAQTETGGEIEGPPDLPDGAGDGDDTA